MGLMLPLFLSMSIAVAQDDGQVAKQFYLNGKMLFEEGRYAEAIIAWEKAYEASEKPVTRDSNEEATHTSIKLRASIATVSTGQSHLTFKRC